MDRPTISVQVTIREQSDYQSNGYADLQLSLDSFDQEAISESLKLLIQSVFLAALSDHKKKKLEAQDEKNNS